MRHHAHDVAFAIANAGDSVERAVGIRRRIEAAVGRAITENDLAVLLEIGKSGGVADVIAVGVRDGNAQHLAGLSSRSEWRGRGLHPNVHVTADKTQSLI